jgi:hypothetical protein
VIPTEWGELGKENWCDRVGSQKYRRFLRVLNVSADDFPFFSSLFLFLSLSFRLADRYGAAAPTCVFLRRFRADSLLLYPLLRPSPPSLLSPSSRTHSRAPPFPSRNGFLPLSISRWLVPGLHQGERVGVRYGAWHLMRPDNEAISESLLFVSACRILSRNILAAV